MIQIQKELINFRGKLESINISGRGFPLALSGSGVSVRGKGDAYECCSYIYTELSDISLSSPALCDWWIALKIPRYNRSESLM